MVYSRLNNKERYGDNIMQKNIIVTLILSVFIAVFAILNAAAVEVNLIFAKVNVSAALIILISASLGAIIVYSIDALSKRRTKKEIKEKEKTIVRMTTELQELTDKYNVCSSDLELLKEQIEIVEENQGVVAIQD